MVLSGNEVLPRNAIPVFADISTRHPIFVAFHNRIFSREVFLAIIKEKEREREPRGIRRMGAAGSKPLDLELSLNERPKYFNE